MTTPRSIYDEKPAATDGPSPVRRQVREVPVDANDRAALLAAVARGGVGVLFVVVSMLFLPIHMLTPIMSGMGVLMTVTGSYACWRVGRAEPRMMPLARVFVWGLPLLCVAGFVYAFIVGPGAYSVAIEDLVGVQEPEPKQFIPY